MLLLFAAKFGWPPCPCHRRTVPAVPLCTVAHGQSRGVGRAVAVTSSRLATWTSGPAVEQYSRAFHGANLSCLRGRGNRGQNSGHQDDGVAKYRPYYLMDLDQYSINLKLSWNLPLFIRVNKGVSFPIYVVAQVKNMCYVALQAASGHIARQYDIIQSKTLVSSFSPHIIRHLNQNVCRCNHKICKICNGACVPRSGESFSGRKLQSKSDQVRPQ